VDVDRIISMITLFTPADIEYLFQKVRQLAFEREYVKGEDYRVTTETFLEMIPNVPSTLTDEIIEDFKQDCAHYTRY
jgi:SpoVK/Ycf46/Vps4 family AAA+-type ATPase